MPFKCECERLWNDSQRKMAIPIVIKVETFDNLLLLSVFINATILLILNSTSIFHSDVFRVSNETENGRDREERKKSKELVNK